MRKDFSPGIRVRAKVPTILGWKGTGTYIRWGMILPDDRPAKRGQMCTYSLDELAIMRDQTPNEEHVAFIAEFLGPSRGS